MREIARYEAEKRVRGSLALAVGLAALGALYVWMFPSVAGTVDLDEYVEALPPALVEAFGLRSLNTIEGFLAAELYAFGWVLLLAIYFAYAAASLVADDVERGRMDLLLALPVRRREVVLGKFASLAVPVVAINAVVPVVLYVGAAAIGEPLSLMNLAAVHLLSVPYHLVAAGIGLFASVSIDRAGVAQRLAAGLVFGLFLVESAVAGTDAEWIGAVSPGRYYDPSDILVDGTYDLAGAAVLVTAGVGLVLASLVRFRRRDVT